MLPRQAVTAGDSCKRKGKKLEDNRCVLRRCAVVHLLDCAGSVLEQLRELNCNWAIWTMWSNSIRWCLKSLKGRVEINAQVPTMLSVRNVPTPLVRDQYAIPSWRGGGRGSPVAEWRISAT